MSETPRAFEYLLNAMENASHHTNPAEHAYGDKRKAVLAYVATLSADLADARAALREIREHHVKLNKFVGRPVERSTTIGICDRVLAKQG